MSGSSRRSFFNSALSGAFALGRSSAAARPPRPNVVFIYTDDQAMWSLGVYGNPDARTASMDRIGREGVVFENSFVTTPVCSPSRGGMMASRYSFEIGIPDWIDPQAQPDTGLPTNLPVWPQLLQRAGYRTGLFGKWHLGGRPEFHPLRRGYDRFVGFVGGGAPPKDPVLDFDGNARKVSGFLPDILTDEAVRFIREQRNGLFLLSLHLREPHLPYGPVPEQDAGLFQGPLRHLPAYRGVEKGWLERNLRDYHRAVASADRCVGRVLAELDALSLTRNTLVIFASDNGYMIGQHGLNTKGNAVWEFGERKGRHRPNMFEPSLRVPLLMRWPGVIAPGQRVPEMVTNLDYFPTILEACQTPVPPGSEPRGSSVLPLLGGQKVPWRSEVHGDYHIVNELKRFQEYDDAMRMVRTQEWKLVTHSDPNYLDELYHLSEDPDEERNLIAEPSAARMKTRLAEQLAAWQSRVNDPERLRARPPKREPYYN